MTTENEKTPVGEGLSGKQQQAVVDFNDNTSPESFIKRGWKIFPVHSISRGFCTCNKGKECDAPGKHPRTRHGVKDASRDPERIAQWVDIYPDTNWGLACGVESDVIVIDVDADKGGFESMADIRLPIGTPTVLTGGGGLHHFFRYAEGIGNRVGWLPGVDIRSDGGYVVLPGGRHIAGGMYQWRAGADGEPPTLPVEVAAKIRESSSRGTDREGLNDSASILDGVPEGQRDDTLFRWACRLRRQHSTDADGGRRVVKMLVLEAARRSGFPEHDALVKVEQAFKQDHAPDVPSWPPVETRLVAGGGFILDEPDEIPAVWGDGEHVLWAEGEGVMIAGHQGLGKTTIAQQLVLARAGVVPGQFLGHTVAPSDRPTLYLAMDRPRQAARSFRRMVSEQDRLVLDDRLVVWKGPLPVDPTVKGRFLEWVREVCPEVGVVVVDSVKDLAPGTTDDTVASALNSAWQSVIADGVELLLLHHERKAPQDGKRKPTLDNIYGSTWLTSGLGSVIALSGQPGDAEVSLHHVKQPGAEVGPFVVVHDHEAGRSTTPTVDYMSVEMALTMHGRLTVKELERLSGRSRNSVIRDLEALGERVVRTDGGMTGSGRQPTTWSMAR